MKYQPAFHHIIAILSFFLIFASIVNAQTVTLTPASLTFTGQAVGSASAAKTVTVKNTSKIATLNIASIVSSGEFALTTTCGATLAVGASCTLSATFSPTTIGPIDGAITLTDNAVPATQIENLTGKGLAPVTFGATTLTFPSTAIGKTSTAKSVTLTNSNAALTMGAITASGDYAISTTTCTGTIAANKTCAISVTFTPTVSGTIAGTMTVNDSAAGSPQTLVLTGTGTGTVTNTVSFSPASLTFASQATGTTSPSQPITLTNTGTTSLTISSVTVSGDYSETDTCAGKSIASKGTCAINVKFSPTSTGTIKGTVTVVDAAATSPQVVALTGTAVLPLTLSPSSLAFAGTVGNTTTPQTATLTNNTSSAVTISKIAVSGDYAQTNTCGTSLAANASCTFSVTFSPLAKGTIDGAVTITFSGTTAPQILSLSGTASVSTAIVARYAYEVEGGGGQEPLIVAYAANPATGDLRPLESLALPSDNFGIVVDPSNKFLYLPDGAQILGFTIPANGLPQPMSGSPFDLVGGSTLIFSPNGKFAYNNLGNEYSLNITSGALKLIGTATTGKFSSYVAINPAGTFVYIPNLGDDTVSAFSVDQTSGVLTPLAGSPFATGESGPNSDTVSPNGEFLFVPNAPTGVASDGTTSVLSINSSTGALIPIDGSPFTTPGGGNGAVVDPTGKFLYVAGSDLGAYSMNSSTGALTAITGSPYTLPAVANAVTIDPSGKFLYVSVQDEPGLITYSINTTSGALTFNENLGNQGQALALATGSSAVVYTPKYAYVAQTNQISEWTINDATGALMAISGSPVTDSNGPVLVAATSSGAFVYTGNSNHTVSEYSVNATTGALTKVSGSPITGFGSVNALAVDPDSGFLYVLDSSNQVFDSYTINNLTGALTKLESSGTTTTTCPGMAIDPAGTEAVVACKTAVDFFGIEGGGIGLAIPTQVTTAGGAAAIDQGSQYVFIAEPASNSVVTFSLASNLKLSSAGTGNNPSAVMAEPLGKYVYVANQSDGTVSAYSLNRATGTLTQIGTAIAAAAGTNAFSVSNDGKYLYATNGSAGTVSIFTINSNGSLTASGTAITGTEPTSIATTGTAQ